MTKHDAIKAYFGDKVAELAQDVPGFNFSPGYPGAVAIVTDYSDKVRKKYIRVGADKEYGFSIILTKEYSTDMDALNLEAMNFAQAFMDWLEIQDKKGIYPEFPDGCQIKKMECLQNMPNLAGINAKEGLARYMIQCKITYFEKEVAV